MRALRGAVIALLAVLLAACGAAPKRPGAFYQDDGPPAAVPPGLERTPDAVPRIEPFHAAANRPYTALGLAFVPITDDRPFRQRGLASWYGRQYHGNRTSIGERYDMLAMSAAHPTLPLPSYARVTNVRDGRSVIVRVNDRGPFKADRVIDLSYAAAVKLGIAAAGTGEVEVVRITHAEIRAGRGEVAAAAPAAAPAPVASAVGAGSAAPAVPAAVAPVPATVEAVPAPAASVSAPLPAPPGAAPLAPSSAPAASPGGPWAVQLGAFGSEANAQALRDRVALLLGGLGDAALAALAPTVRVERDGALLRVLAGGLADRGAALALAAQLERALERPAALYRRP